MHTKRHVFSVVLVTMFALSACGSEDSASSSADEPASGGDATSTGDAATSTDADEASADADEASADADIANDDSADPGVTRASGGGVVTIDGVAYTFDTEICLFEESAFVIVGPGSDPNGDPAYVDIGGSSDTDYDLDGQPDEEIMVNVEVGATQMGMGTEDQPSFSASALEGTTAEQITFERTVNSVSGSGTMTDNNYVAAEFDEPIPFEFEASCG